MSVRFLSGINVDNNVLFVDSANDRVGIGTASPAYRLDVNGASRLGSNFIVDSNGDVYQPTTGGVALWAAIANATYPSYGFYGDTGIGMYRAAADTLAFSTSDTERLRITAAGNVGIGTTSPGDKLTVSVGNVEGIRVQSSNSGFVEVGKTGGARWRWTNEYNSANIFELLVNDLSGSAPGQNVFTVNGVNGNIGIGTISPSQKLHINGGNVAIDNSSDVSLIFAKSGASKYEWYLDNASNNFGLYDRGNTSWRFFVTNAGYVGIGTTSPGAKLHVSGGEIRVDAGQAVTLDTSNGMYLVGASSQLRIYNGGNPVVNITTGGNVGIGTTSPATALDVSGDARFGGGATKLSVYSDSTYSGIFNGASLVSNESIYMGDSKIFIITAGTEKVRITSAGNVGIGTTSPSYKLDVNGATQIQNELILSTNDAAFRLYRTTGVNYFDWSSGQDLRFSTVTSIGGAGRSTAVTFLSTGEVGIGTASPGHKLSVFGGDAIFTQYTGTGNGSSLTIVNSTTTSDGTALQASYFGSGGYGPLKFEVGGSERMRITSAGNVGIGTTSPNYKLDVNGSINIYSGNSLRWGSGDVEILNSGYSMLFSTYTGSALTEKMRITSAGNVGIGITSPAEKLHTIGNIKIEQTSNTNAVLTLHPYSSALGTDYQWNLVGANSTQNYGFQIRQASTIYLHINNSANGDAGNVGIGTTSPSTKLHVVGDIKGAALQVYDGLGAGVTGVGAASAGGALRLYSNGAVGITLNTSGAVQLNDYGSGSNTGTATQRLAVDASGNVIEIPIGSGPVDGNGTANYVTKWSDADTITNSIIYDNGTNVGIGNTSPTAKLQVGPEAHPSATGIEVAAGAGGANLLALTNTTNHNWFPFTDGRNYYSAIEHTFRDEFHSTNWMKITSAGNVGIGTTSPAEKLHISGGTDTAIIRLENTSTALSAGDTLGAVQFYNNDTTDNSPNIAASIYAVAGPSGGSGQLRFKTKEPGTEGGAATDTMTLTNGGNVGIGTTSPGYKLDVNGAINSTTATTSGTGTLNLGTTVEPRIAGQITGTQSPSYSSTGKLGFSVTTWGVGSDYGLTEVMAIDMRGADSKAPTIWMNPFGGNVGIGTTTPVSIGTGITTLDIQGSNAGGVAFGPSGFKNYIYGASTMYVEAHTTAVFTTSGSEKMRITSAGNVGIGTTSPTVISGYIAQTFDGVNGSFIDYRQNGTALFRIGADTSRPFLYGMTNAPMDFYTNTNFAMRIDAAGNVGIGSSAPKTKLHINGGGIAAYHNNSTDGAQIYLGDGNFDNTSYWNSAPGIGAVYAPGTSVAGDLAFYVYTGAASSRTERMRIVTGGNVGIGTTSPESKLHVAGGDVLISNGQYYGVESTTGGNYKIAGLTTGNVVVVGAIDYTSAGTIFAGGDNVNFTIGGVAGSTIIKISSSGNVGIGTTSPATKLHVVGYSRTDGGILVNGGVSDYREIIFTTSAAARWNLYAYGAEGGGNAGSVLNLARYADDGSYLSGVMTFLRTNGYVGVNTGSPSEQLHVTGNIRVTGAYYDSNNEAGTSGQVLTSTGSGTDWVTPATTTASSLYDLLPAARTTYDWTVQMTSGTWADIFSSNTVLSNGTWMVQVYVSDFASGGQQYQETYSGVMSWGNANSTNQGGASAISEVVLHRSGHAANAGQFYLRTQERASSTLLLQGMVNYSHTSNTTINFKFVKVF